MLPFTDNSTPPDYDGVRTSPPFPRLGWRMTAVSGAGRKGTGRGAKGEERVVRTLSPDSSGQGQWRRVTSYGAAVTQSVARGNPLADGRQATLLLPL